MDFNPDSMPLETFLEIIELLNIELILNMFVKTINYTNIF